MAKINRSISTVALFGASGNLGRYILHSLLEASFIVTIFLRPESKFEITPATINGFPPTRLKLVKVSFENEQELVKKLIGQDAVVVSISKGGIAAQKILISAAVKAGVQRFIPSEFGGDTLNEGLMNNVPILQEKKAVLDYIRKVSETIPSFKWTGISSAAFLDWGIESGFFGFTISTQTGVIYSAGTKRFNATTRETIGKAVALSLRSPEFENRYIYIADLTTSQNEILDELERQSGTKWRIVEKSAYTHREEGEVHLKEGNFPLAASKLLLGNLFGEGHGTLIDDRLLENRALGLQTVSLNEAVTEALRNYFMHPN